MLTLRNSSAELHLDLDAGGRVSRLLVGGLEVVAHPGSEPTRWGSFVMAPWAGRIRGGRFGHGGTTHQLPTDASGHAIHGTVLDRPAAILDSAATSAVLECELGDAWPWRGRVRQRVRLDPTGASFDVEVHASRDPFPAAVGWHPWFRRRLAAGAPVEIGLDASTMLVRDGDGIPSGERVPVAAGPWDDCFDGVRWPVTLTWPGALRLEVRADTRYVVVYDQPEHTVCVEPQTGPPDAPTLEPVVVTPGHPLTAAMTWRWTDLRPVAGMITGGAGLGRQVE